MKKTLIFIIIILAASQLAMAQRYAYMDRQYVLNKLPSYQTVQTKLDDFAKKRKAELDAKYKQIDLKYKEFQNEKVLLSDEMKKKKEDEIISLERETKKLTQQYFGENGEVYKKEQELMKPILDEMTRAVKEVAEDGNYAMIFNIAYSDFILYANIKYDVSDDVLKKISF